jgi:hypothetical protein
LTFLKVLAVVVVAAVAVVVVAAALASEMTILLPLSLIVYNIIRLKF